MDNVVKENKQAAAAIKKSGGSMKIKRSTGDIVFDTVNIAITVLITLIMIYPMWYVIIVSLARYRGCRGRLPRGWPERR